MTAITAFGFRAVEAVYDRPRASQCRYTRTVVLGYIHRLFFIRLFKIRELPVGPCPAVTR